MHPTKAPVRLKFLVVEDDLDLALIYEGLLTRAGHQVAIAHDGSSGIVHARMNRPDVVLADLELPGYSGSELARRLVLPPISYSGILVALSAVADGSHQKVNGGAFDLVFMKPVRFSELLDAVYGAL